MNLLHEAVAALISESVDLGYIVAYKQEQGGRLIQHIFPKKEHESEQISGSSKTKLALHTETAFHPYRPDYVVLLCLRGDPAAGTTYANVNDVVARLQPVTVETLLKPKFVTSVDKSFRTGGEEDQQVVLPVLTKTRDGKFTMVYDEDLMTGVDASADDALRRLEEAIEESVREVVLKAGDVLIIDNNTSVHGRYPFTPRYDGTDRWLLRALVRKELPPVSDFVNGVITTARFGDSN
jgi:L-asparagine oxygenase